VTGYDSLTRLCHLGCSPPPAGSGSWQSTWGRFYESVSALIYILVKGQILNVVFYCFMQGAVF
jgi:hypothetical protein